MTAVLLAVIARVPEAGVADFQAYEDQVLPLLSEHDGRLDRRLRNSDGTVEVHLVRFASRDAFERYRQDPRRQAASATLHRSQARIEVMQLNDVN